MEEMVTIIDIIKSPTFWGLAVPFFSAVIFWFMNEKSKRNWESYKSREEKYINLIENLEGFYESSIDTEKKRKFINELKLCWLYAPDNVIMAANTFLKYNSVGTNVTMDERHKSVGKLILEIRKDLKNTKNKLSEKDFLHWRAS